MVSRGSRAKARASYMRFLAHDRSCKTVPGTIGTRGAEPIGATKAKDDRDMRKVAGVAEAPVVIIRTKKHI